MFNIVHQQLRDYVLALLVLLSYVTMSLTSIVYVEPMPNASTHINYPHLYEERASFVLNTYITFNKPCLVVFVVFFHFVFILREFHETLR